MWIAYICWIFFLFLYYPRSFSSEEQRVDHRHRHRHRRFSPSNNVGFIIDNIANKSIDSNVFHSVSSDKYSFGYQLPSFSFDFSEFILGAMIERSSDSDDLFLVIYTLNLKRILSDTSLIEAISTDIPIVESWNHVIQRFNGSTSSSSSSTSNYICLLHNNDPKHKAGYQSLAHKVSIPSDMNSYFDIIRCRLRGTSNVYTTLSHSNLSLHIELLRKASKVHHTTISNTYSIDKLSSSSSSNPYHIDPRTLLLSFSIPWRKRYAGYGFHFDFHYNLHLGLNSSAHHHKTSILSSENNIGIDPWEVPSSTGIYSKKKYKFGLCVGISQPLHLSRANVPLPMLLEFIEHHLSIKIGFDHIFLGILISSKSSELIKYQSVLSSYIKSSRLTLVPLAMDNYDDIAGITSAGIVFKQSSDILRQIFMNQCLYYSKGIFDLIGIVNPNDYILPLKSDWSLNNLFDHYEDITNISTHRILRDEKTISSASHSIKSITHHSQHQQHQYSHHYRGKNSSYSSSHSYSHSQTTPHGLQSMFCSSNSSTSRLNGTLRLRSYGIPDPPDSFGGWGPGETSWARDYFQKSSLFGPLRNTMSTLFLPTRHTMFTSGERAVMVSCIPHTISTVTTTSSTTTSHSKSHSIHGFNPSSYSNTYEESKYRFLSLDDIVVLTYQGLDPHDITDLDSAKCTDRRIQGCDILPNPKRTERIYSIFKESINLDHQHLSKRGYDSIATIKSMSKRFSIQTKVDSIKEPYWKKCKRGKRSQDDTIHIIWIKFNRFVDIKIRKKKNNEFILILHILPHYLLHRLSALLYLLTSSP